MEGAFSWYYQHTVYIIYRQEQIRLFVQQVAVLKCGFKLEWMKYPSLILQQPLVGQGLLIIEA